MVGPVGKVQKANKVQPVLMDLLDPAVLVELTVNLVMMAGMVNLARMLKMVLKVHVVVLDLLVNGVKLVLLVLQEPMENPVLREMLAQWDPLVLWALPVFLVPLVRKASKVLVVTRVTAVVRVLGVLLVSTDHLVHAVPLVK